MTPFIFIFKVKLFLERYKSILMSILLYLNTIESNPYIEIHPLWKKKYHMNCLDREAKRPRVKKKNLYITKWKLY